MGGCRCSFQFCDRTTATHPGTHFFHYPVKHPDRLERWCFYSNTLEYIELPEDKLRNKVVCQEHFRDNNFMNIKKERLIKLAIPTLLKYLDGEPIDLEELEKKSNCKTMNEILETQLPSLAEKRNPPPPPVILNNTVTRKRPILTEYDLKISENSMSETIMDQPHAFVNVGGNSANAQVLEDFIVPSYVAPQLMGVKKIKMEKIKIEKLPDNGSASVLIDGSKKIITTLKKCTPPKSSGATNMKVLNTQRVKPPGKIRPKSSPSSKSPSKHAAAAPINTEMISAQPISLEYIDSNVTPSPMQLTTLTEQAVEDSIKKGLMSCNLLNMETFNDKVKVQETAVDDIKLLLNKINSNQEQILEKLKTPESINVVGQNEATSTSPGITKKIKPEFGKSKFNQTKIQLFNGIKKYLNPAMVALLRMELFGTSERGWKNDEKSIAVELLNLGTGTYEYLRDEWRFRLPPKKDVEEWMSSEVGLDDSDDE